MFKCLNWLNSWTHEHNLCIYLLIDANEADEGWINSLHSNLNHRIINNVSYRLVCVSVPPPGHNPPLVSTLKLYGYVAPLWTHKATPPASPPSILLITVIIHTMTLDALGIRFHGNKTGRGSCCDASHADLHHLQVGEKSCDSCHMIQVTAASSWFTLVAWT